MRIKILGWGYENIRKINTLELDFQDNPHRTTLIMMRNGTGKTTTMALMRAILSGSAKKWTSERVKGFQPLHSTKETGKFTMRMQFDDKTYCFILTLNYKTGQASYQTSNTGLTGGLENGLRLPMSIQGAFDNEEFIRRFIFDGEQAKMILNNDHREAENAVVHLYHINKLDELIAEIQKIVEQKQALSDGTVTERAINQNRNSMLRKKKNLHELKERATALQQEAGALAERQNKLENEKQELINTSKDLRNEKDELIRRQDEKGSALSKELDAIKIYTRRPYLVNYLFHERLQSLSQSLKDLRLPKTTAREFFNELANSTTCVCGRPIGPDESNVIKSRAEQYLGAEELIAINAIKGAIRSYQLDDGLNLSIKNMVKLRDEIQEIDGALQRLYNRLNAVDAERIEKIDHDLKAIERQEMELRRELSQLNAISRTNDLSEENNIKLAQIAFEEAAKRFFDLTGTFKFTRQADKLIAYIKSIRQMTLDNFKQTILQKTNKKIAQIITDEKITVEKIDGNLKIKDRDGLSEGQTLAVAYAYVSSLFEHSTFKFPFVVDSPAISMDLGVRREIADIIPKIFEQLFIFVISSEVAGFAERFYEMDDVQYLTVIGKDSMEEAECIADKAYFASYQSEED